MLENTSPKKKGGSRLWSEGVNDIIFLHLHYKDNNKQDIGLCLNQKISKTVKQLGY